MKNELERLLTERAADETARVTREKAIDALQAPIMQEVIDILNTSTLAEAKQQLTDLLPKLVDYRRGSVQNTINSLESLRMSFTTDINRINATSTNALFTGV